MRIGNSLREFQVPAPPIKNPVQTGQPGHAGVAPSGDPFLERLTQAVRQVNDLQVEAGLQAYDIVALIPVIEGAGGVVTSWTGGSAADGGKVVASGDPRLHEKALRLLAAA